MHRRPVSGVPAVRAALLAVALCALAFGTARAQNNRVANPGFEYGVAPWYDLTTSGQIPRSGTSCGSVFMPAFGGSPGQNMTGKLHAEQTYTASAWLRVANTGSTMRVRMTLYHLDSDGSHVTTILDTNTLTTSWTQYTANFTLNVTGTLADVSIAFRNLANASGTVYLDDVSITGSSPLDVPGPGDVAFALDGARPNPSRADRLELSFALPASDAARIELLDVSGRLVATREVGSLGAGRHSVDLAEGRRVAPGLYFARLSQRGISRTVRVAVVK